MNNVETAVGRAHKRRDTDKHNMIPMIVAKMAEVSPIVHMCGQCRDTFVRAHGIRRWGRRTDAVGAIRVAVTRNITQRQVVRAPNRKLLCKSLCHLCLQHTHIVEVYMGFGFNARIAGILCGSATTRCSRSRWTMTTWCAVQTSGGPKLWLFAQTDAAARNRVRTECNHEVGDFFQESAFGRSGLVQDDELVERHGFVNEAPEAGATVDAKRSRGRI